MATEKAVLKFRLDNDFSPNNHSRVGLAKGVESVALTIAGVQFKFRYYPEDIPDPSNVFYFGVLRQAGITLGIANKLRQMRVQPEDIDILLTKGFGKKILSRTEMNRLRSCYQRFVQSLKEQKGKNGGESFEIVAANEDGLRWREIDSGITEDDVRRLIEEAGDELSKPWEALRPFNFDAVRRGDPDEILRNQANFWERHQKSRG